ncbi:anti-sigma factor antagonist [Candidatus Peregrinibacteria bacterium]|jgi:anti-anti-sigma factor|nr:anti-sigma factor antagonist [Candidatus Peregrinibacteria bacterium]MBT4631868.1 anti-sigma factor antagonist [Candidatus Peregrinibacteria bacterium]MBT5517020.1 anti-sigma factor antagonist [Candidatus Peregrinibacteria bacterium]MBT5824211.1 anti-sigma factor antagonist [Candidatus Peregrinibacteria bacterium]
MAQVQITIEDLAGAAEGKTIKLVHLVGQLDESNVDEEAKKIYQLIESVPQGLNLIFNLEGLEYMNSKSIGYMTDWYSKVSGSGGKIVIAAARENILDILQVVGLTQLVTAYATLEEAKLAVNQ